jgi:peptidoglycan/xylan/chitin deacetylase (PgdA/CDA1 family)
MNRLPILCYHKVGPADVEGRFLNVEPATLRAQIGFLKRRGLQFVLARDLRAPWPERAVCLTFDDAYSSFHEHGTPILLDCSVRASVYAVAGRVGQTSCWDRERARPLMSWDALRSLQDQGFEIGNHTVDHPALANLDRFAIAEQIRSAHERLVAEGIRPETVCYPYGSTSETVGQVAREAGYSIGLALGKRLARPSDPRHALPRIVVAYSDWVPKFWYRVFVRPMLREFAQFGGPRQQ